MPPFEPSRREFLAASAFGVLGLVKLVHDEEHPSDSALLYVGTYTGDHRQEGIYLVEMDTGSGALRRADAQNAGPNPSFLAIHPNGRVLYAVNEVDEWNGRASGAVSAFAIGDSGRLTRINEVGSGGAGPCYVSVDRSGRFVLVANYTGGSVAVLPIQADGGLLPASYVSRHEGHGPNAERQEAPHAHSIVASPSNRFVLAADLGIDEVLVYVLDASGQLPIIDDAAAHLRPGTGPRHLAFHPHLPLVFVVGELDSSITTLRLDPAGGLTTVARQSTLPQDWTGTSYAGDIHVDPLGRHLYVSNRGHNSIALFAIAGDTGALTLDQAISTQGDWPRNFALDPTGRWLLVANQHSGNVAVLARDARSGRLAPTSQELAIPTPACLRFRAQTGVVT